MADQARWFKLWCSAPDDDALQALPPALRWAWAAFGAYTKLHGTNGVIQVRPTNAVLAAQVGVPTSELLTTLGCLPSICLGTAPVRWPHGHEKHPVCEGEFMRGSYPLDERGRGCLEKWCSRHGELTVTWRNWTKYQEDTTQAQRGAASRSKKRRDEMRRDEKRLNPPIVPPPGGPELEILSWLNLKTGKNFRPKETNLAFIRGRLADGIESWQLKAIISRKTREWVGTERATYLRPSTLFNKTKCEQYLGELPADTTSGSAD